MEAQWIRGMSAAVVGEDFRMWNRHQETPTHTQTFCAEKDLAWKHIAETADSMRIFPKGQKFASVSQILDNSWSTDNNEENKNSNPQHK